MLVIETASREEGAKLNSATQNAVGYELAQLLDTTQGDVLKLTIKEVFRVCREKFCSINGAPVTNQPLGATKRQ